MKKFLLCLMACVATLQSSYVLGEEDHNVVTAAAINATSGLTESLLEMEAILNAIGTDPRFEGVIPSTQFIVELERISKKINKLGTVKYRIETCVPSSKNKKDCRRIETYTAVLDVRPNPGIGPNIITVISIKKN